MSSPTSGAVTGPTVVDSYSHTLNMSFQRDDSLHVDSSSLNPAFVSWSFHQGGVGFDHLGLGEATTEL